MLEKLKEYKELIGILVFFLGGFFWLQREFPTKADLKNEIGILNCLVDKYMTLTQRQMRGQELDRQIQELDKQIKNKFSTSRTLTLSPAMEQEFEELKKDLSNKKNALNENTNAMVAIGEELQRNICRKGTP
jgi:hypothetical protein